MRSPRKPRSLLQVIENMGTGGAQRTVELLSQTPGVQSQCLCYDRLLDSGVTGHFDAMLLHVWRRDRNSARLNWPGKIDGAFLIRAVFNHDWCGIMNAGAARYFVYSEFARSRSICDGPIAVLPCGIDMSDFASIQRPTGDHSDLVIGRLSTMWPSKIDLSVLHYWPRLRAGRFLIGGNGPMRASLIHEFASDTRFEFPGEVARVDVPAFLQHIDVFLYDTPWHIESFCYATLEAMAAGCVVVARRKGAIPDQIADGDTGFLFDNEAEAIEIVQRLSLDHTLLNQVAARARESATRRYPLAKFHAQFLKAMQWT